jgi:hypothetical protein
MCSGKLLVMAKKNINIQPGNAEYPKLIRKGVKHTTCANSVWCLSTWVNVSRDITYSLNQYYAVSVSQTFTFLFHNPILER